VHELDAREGGSFRVSLTYDAPNMTGKTSARTDTYHGRVVKLVPGEQVVEVLEFETTDPALSGEMTITTTLSDADGGTDVLLVHEGIPRGVSAVDNETGTRMSLGKLAALVEAGQSRVEGDAAEAVGRLKEESDEDLTILGSGVLISSLMERSLIDQYVLMIHPLVLGSGRRLFADDGTYAALTLTDTLTTTTGVVIATYQLTNPVGD